MFCCFCRLSFFPFYLFFGSFRCLFFKSLLFFLLYLYWLSLIPYPLYCGSILTIISVDNGNIGFLLLSIILFPLIDWIAGFESKTMNFSFLLFYLFFGLILCFLLISLYLVKFFSLLIYFNELLDSYVLYKVDSYY